MQCLLVPTGALVDSAQKAHGIRWCDALWTIDSLVVKEKIFLVLYTLSFTASYSSNQYKETLQAVYVMLIRKHAHEQLSILQITFITLQIF